MPLKPEVKARQIAAQEARWAKDRGETPTQFDEPEMPISVTADEVLANPKAFPPAVQREAKLMKEELIPAPKKKKAAPKKKVPAKTK